MNGYKTYLVAAIGILALVAVNVFGIPIPGMAPSGDWMTTVLGLLGLGALRHGVAK